MADTIREAIEDAGKAGIESASGDAGSVTQMSADDQIKRDQYVSGATARTKNHLGLTFRQFTPGNTG